MAIHEKAVFTDTVIDIDEHEYVDCKFVNCTFRYRGTLPVNLHGKTEIDGGRIELTACAANTAMVLKGLYDLGMKKAVLDALGIREA